MCTRGKIFLYDDKWTELETKIVKDGFEHMKTITYDPVNDVFYFHDRKHPTTSIFVLKVRDDTTFLTTPLVARTENEVIEDLVYDFHDKALYWSDSGNKKIEKLSIDSSKNLKTTRETFLNVSGAVSGMEIDSCQRNLYFTIVTVDNPSINVISLDKKGAKPISFGAENHAKPVAVAMDHQNRRLYIADDRGYNSYSIDSLKPDGSDFRTEIEKTHKTPRGIAVDSQYVYYIEGNNNELRRFAKNADKKTSELFKEYSADPSDIIVRSNSITDLDPSKCKLPATSISNVKKEMEQKAQEKGMNSKMCLHGGTLDKTTLSCMCKENFDGDFCEINLCYNFCLNGGECSMNKVEPTCSCKRGFAGLHCELDVCSNYCLNDGKCSVGANKKPKCACSDTLTGSRCELLNGETLPVIIDANKKIELSSTIVPTIKVPESSEHHEINILDELPENLTHNADDRVQPDVFQCPQQQINPTFIILGVCITISLLIFLAILFVIKRIHKPMRPRIRKKYVVHKNSEQLTYRPTTEQCEVIIEDCCNMNICETVSVSGETFKITVPRAVLETFLKIMTRLNQVCILRSLTMLITIRLVKCGFGTFLHIQRTRC